MVKRFEFIEHTADVAVRVFGGSLKELFSSAAMAMFAVLVQKKGNFSTPDLQEFAIEKKEEAVEDLLKAWLDELLYHYATRQLVLSRVKALECSDHELIAKVLLDRFDPQHYEARNEIKAVTYHELKVERVRNHWEATVIFDV